MVAGADFYETLGVAKGVGADELQRAYRSLARKYHPDVNKDPDAESMFKDISEAYDVLSDPATRRKYDSFGSDFRRVPDGTDPDAWARAQRPPSGRGPRGAAQAGPNDWSAEGFGNGGADFDFDEMFGGIFGSRQRASRGPVLGANQESELVLTVEEAYRGGRRTLSFTGPDGPRTFDVNVPAGVTTGKKIRSRDKEGGEPGAVRRATCSSWCDSHRTPLPGGRRRHHGPATAHAMGGRSRDDRHGRHPRRRDQGAGQGRDVQRDQTPTEGARHAIDTR